MLIIEENSVYEIDEECIHTRKVPPQCKTYEKILQTAKSKQVAAENIPAAQQKNQNL